MTHTEFAAWLDGINTALGGNPPPPELLHKIVETAKGIGAQKMPPCPDLAKVARELKDSPEIKRKLDEIAREAEEKRRKAGDWPATPNPYVHPYAPNLWPITCDAFCDAPGNVARPFMAKQ